ncbi:MAG: outer membrane lipoprotein-sorting protein, partial [bacterium]
MPHRSPMSRITLTPLLALLLALPLLTSGAPPQPDAAALVEAADQRLRGETQRGTYRMEITTPRWTRTLEMRVWGKGTEYFLIRIDEPAEEAGTGFLKIENEVWSYLPSVEKTIKIPPSMMHQSWMGSDFTY